ncbi:MAG: type II secretion system GspH family protein [Fimbriimonadaceae bacterium]|nr:type II secretion system protein [Chthonomonadaceae bacterium]MCO5295893.1 type II secretion system GspH family protein [Fimbriimonadaceae bacterium]
MKRRKRRGTTMVEVLVASVISFLVLMGAAAALLFGMAGWARGQARIDSETQSQQAIRQVSKLLREAMVVTVDGNGNGLNYRLPVKDENGNFVLPATWDGVTRRIEVNGSDLNLVVDGATRNLCSGVILTDPLDGNQSYRVFTPGAGTITRQLWMKLATSTMSSDRHKTMTSRGREMIYLRNIPQLTN